MTALLTENGRSLVTRLLTLTHGALAFGWVGWGTGSGSVGSSDTSLFAEIAPQGGVRILGTKAQQTILTSNDAFLITATLTSDRSQVITNAGVFNGASIGGGGNLLLHADFPACAVNAGDAVQFSFLLSFV